MTKLTTGQLEIVDYIELYLRRSEAFFIHRDEMNAKVHESETRLSPLTNSAVMARREFKMLIEGLNQ